VEKVYTLAMFYAQVQSLKPTAFKRLTGVPPETFTAMSAALQHHLPAGGRTPKLSIEDRLLMTLMYWREYRTEFHIAHTYGISEATVSRTIRAIEDALLRSGQFTLPGKKALTQSDVAFEVVVVDATECPVERPKKNNAAVTVARRSATPKKCRSSLI
jgi:hypothetical protein